MNKQERKECQYSDYYRMTGEDIYYIEYLENLDWRFRPKPL